MLPAQAAPISTTKPSTDQASSSGKAKSSRRRSSHERQRRDDADEKAEAKAEVAAAAPLEDVQPKQVTLAGDYREMSAKSKRGIQGGDSRVSGSSEKQPGEAKRRQNQGGDGKASAPVDSVRPSKWRRSESGVVLAGPPTPPSPLDRWDGSLLQVEAAVAPLPSFESGKQIPNFLDATIPHSGGYVKEKESDGDMKSCKGKSRAVLTTESRLISTVDVADSLMQIDGVLSSASIHAKNKSSRKKDIEVTVSEQEKGQIENVLAEVDLPQVLEHNADLGSRSKKSGSRRRWEEEIYAKEKEMNLHPSVHIVENKERGKRKDKGMEIRGAKSSKYEKEVVLEDLEPFVKRKNQDANKHPRSSEDKELRTSEWQIQEELRNLELEKELENRIRRRKEESSEKDRWKDDDKERESRRHFDHREDRIREQSHRDDRSRRERHGDRPENKNCRKESRYLEGQSREDRYHESGRDRKLFQDEPISHKKDKLEQLSAADFDLDYHSNDRRVRSSKDGVIDSAREGHSKSYKEEMPEREWIALEQSNFKTNDAGESEHERKRAQESLSVDSGTKEGDRSREKLQEKDRQVNHEESDVLLEDKAQSRNRNARDVEESCEPVRDHRREQQGRNRSEKRPKHQSSNIIRSPYHEARASPSIKVDGSSPVADDRLYTYKKSPSPAIFDGNRPLSRTKPASGERLELTYSMSSSSATQHRRDNGSQVRDRGEHRRRHSEEEEVKSEDLVCSRKVHDETRNGSPSPRKSQDLYLPLPPLGPQFSRQEAFSRASAGRSAMEMKIVGGREEAISRDRESWRETFPSGMPLYDTRASDELFSRERSERIRLGPPVNRSMLRPQSLSLASLPPPPPFRHGIDNPSILGPPGNAHEEGSSSRDLGRLDRKPNVLQRRIEAAGTLGPGDAWRGAAIGNWNPRSHGPGPGNAFPPYQPHHYGAHPPALFSGVGRQFSGPPLFGPGRAHMDMNYGGGRFIGPSNRLGGEAFHVQGRGPGWHGPLGDDIRPPVFVPIEGWEGHRPSSDEVRHGWDCAVGPLGGMPWEQDRDVWELRQKDGIMDFPPHAPHQAPASGHGAPSGMPLAMKVGEDKVVDTRGGEQEEECEVASSKLASKDTVIAKPPKDDKFRKKSLAAMKTILSKLDISAKLAGSDLYGQYESFVSASMPATKPIIGMREKPQDFILSDEDCIMEADLEAEALLSQLQVPENRLPPLPEGAFEAALSNYKKPEEEHRVVKSAIGSFVLSFNPKAISFHHLVTQQVNQQPATVQADKLLFDATSAAISDMHAGTVNAINLIEVDKATEVVMSPKFSHSCDMLLSQGGPTSVDVADHSDSETFNVEIEDKLNEDSIGGLQVFDLVRSVVEGEEEQADVELYRDPTVLGTIIVEEVEMQIDMGSHSFEHPLTSVIQFESGCSLSSPLDEPVSLVQYSEAPNVGEVLQIRSPTSKGNDENNIEGGTYCSEDGLVICDSNSENKQLVVHQWIGDKQVVIDSEDVCSESSKEFSEAEMCMEKGVRELACFMFIPKRNRKFISHTNISAQNLVSQKAIDIITYKFLHFISIQGKSWVA